MKYRCNAMLIVLMFFFVLSCDESDFNNRVLIISNSKSDNETIANEFSSMNNIKFDTWAIDGEDIPDTLEEYDAVLLFENGVMENSEKLSSMIYNYVVNGGGLIIGTYYWQQRSDGGYNGSWGALESIDPLMTKQTRSNLKKYRQSGKWLQHALTEGIDTIGCYVYDICDSLRSDAQAVAWWENGDILMAYNEPGEGRIVAVTVYPAEAYYGLSGRYGCLKRIWENAINFSMEKTY